MQIHELTQPRKPQLAEAGILNYFSRDAEQGRINQRAAKAVAKLEKNLPKAEPVPTLDQAMAKLKANPAAQQWINSVVAKWPAIAERLADTTPTPTPAVTEDDTPNPVVNPTPTLNTRPTSRFKKTPAPAPVGATGDQVYATKVRQWINSALKTTSLDELEKDAEVKSKLEPLLTQIVAAKDNPTKQQELVRNFFTLAVAANHVVQAKQKDPLDPAYQGRNNAPTGQPLSNTQKPVDTGLGATELLLLSRAAQKAGGPAPGSTGNEFYDSLIQQIQGR